MKPKVLLATAEERYQQLFLPRDVARIKDYAEIIAAPIPETPDKDFLRRHLGEAEVVVTSWQTARLDEEVLAAAPKLKLLAHAAGSVKPVVSEALFERGVRVTSAAAALAYGVAEFCLGLILLAPKRACWAKAALREGAWREGVEVFHGPFEIYRQTIGIIGASHVGRHLIGLLKNFDCEVLLYDPYCDARSAAALGATKVDSLEELFGRSRIVSLNAPSTEETKGMIRGRHFALLSDGAVFINTARGAIIDEAEMIEELQKQRFVACLDVTEPEPPAADSPLRRLPNVMLTPHIAGAIAENLARIGTFVADEIEAFAGGGPLHFEVTKERLDTMG